MCVKFASDDQLEHVIMFLDDRLYYRVIVIPFMSL